MRIFNDIIDLGADMDENVLIAVNALVLIHFVAFLVLIVIVMRNMWKTDQTLFIEQVNKMATQANAKKSGKKDQ